MSTLLPTGEQLLCFACGVLVTLSTQALLEASGRRPTGATADGSPLQRWLGLAAGRWSPFPPPRVTGPTELDGKSSRPAGSAEAPPPTNPSPSSAPASIADAAKDDEDEEEGEEEERPDDIPCKLVFVVRTDLDMTKGKVAAQCGHAVLAAYDVARRAGSDSQHGRWLGCWRRGGQAKIALAGRGGEEELLELQAKALSLGLVARSICDAGRTQVAAGSRTVLAIGPGPVALVNEITGHLRLY